MHFVKRSDMVINTHAVLPANNKAMHAFTPQPQSINALRLVAILSSHRGYKAELHTEIKCRPPGVELGHGHLSQY